MYNIFPKVKSLLKGTCLWSVSCPSNKENDAHVETADRNLLSSTLGPLENKFAIVY